MARAVSEIKNEEIIRAGNFKQDFKHVEKVIKDCSFVHQMEITLPNAYSIPDFVRKNATDFDNEYYLLQNCSLLNFLDYDFIRAFIKTGKFYCLSLGTRLDVDDCVALIPSGKIILNLTKDSYEELGVEGRKAKFNCKSNKFVIEINLLAEYFYPGKANYDKLVKVFQERTCFDFNFLCTWEPHDSSISSRSIYAYFKSKVAKADICTNQHWAKCVYSNPTPVISWNSLEGDFNSVNSKDFFEWLGAVTCDVDLLNTPDVYVSTYVCPQPSEVVGQTAKARWTGFLTSDSVSRMLENIKRLKESGKFSWIALTVFGFDDSPVIGNQDHGVAYTAGDNLYTLVLFPNEGYWLYKNRIVGTK